MERPDPRLELIAAEVKRLGEALEEEANKLRGWILRQDAELDRLWHELGLKRARREGSHRTTDWKD